MRRGWSGLVAATLLGACWQPPADELVLRVPSSPLYGVEQVRAEGGFEWLVLAVDGVELASGPGPELLLEWDTTAVDDGEHLVRASGWNGDHEAITWREVTVSQAQGDEEPPRVEFLEPVTGDIFTDDFLIVVQATDDVALTGVDVFDGATLLATMRPEGPFELLWQDPPIGDHTLKAVAYDVAGRSSQDTVDVKVGQ